jgi:hypothetical protein
MEEEKFLREPLLHTPRQRFENFTTLGLVRRSGGASFKNAKACRGFGVSNPLSAVTGTYMPLTNDGLASFVQPLFSTMFWKCTSLAF